MHTVMKTQLKGKLNQTKYILVSFSFLSDSFALSSNSCFFSSSSFSLISLSFSYFSFINWIVSEPLFLALFVYDSKVSLFLVSGNLSMDLFRTASAEFSPSSIFCFFLSSSLLNLISYSVFADKTSSNKTFTSVVSTSIPLALSSLFVLDLNFESNEFKWSLMDLEVILNYCCKLFNISAIDCSTCPRSRDPVLYK